MEHNDETSRNKKGNEAPKRRNASKENPDRSHASGQAPGTCPRNRGNSSSWSLRTGRFAPSVRAPSAVRQRNSSCTGVWSVSVQATRVKPAVVRIRAGPDGCDDAPRESYGHRMVAIGSAAPAGVDNRDLLQESMGRERPDVNGGGSPNADAEGRCQRKQGRQAHDPLPARVKWRQCPSNRSFGDRDE